MPYIYNKKSEQLKLLLGNDRLSPCNPIQDFKIVYDTEFSFNNKLTVESIQLFCPELNNDIAIIYPYEELSSNFNPFQDCLKLLGYNLQEFNEELQTELLGSIYDIYEGITEELTDRKEIRRAFKQALKQGCFDTALEAHGLDRKQLKLISDRDELEPIVELPKINIRLEAFFADVDLFKLLGQQWQAILLDESLVSRRVIKTDKGLINLQPLYIDGVLYELTLALRDAMNRFPVLSGRGLDNQCKVYQTDFKKLNVESEELAEELGLPSIQAIKENMNIFRKHKPSLFYQYAANDVYATASLSEKHQSLLDGIRSNFNLTEAEVKDTTGSNVSSFILALIHKYFNEDADKKLAKIVTSQIRLSHADKLQNVELNNFGIQPFRTVGGLLYSRMQRYPYHTGLLGDLDMSSCYATRLSSLTLYLGQPIITTFKLNKNKPKFKDVVNFITQSCYRDAWFIRVSGKLKEAINTIVLSDLDFNGKAKKFKTIFDLEPNRKSINQFNAYKVSNPEAKSTLLTKEIKFGLINADILDCINLLPASWVDEFYSLLVDAIVFIPKKLVCDSLEELEAKKEEYPEDEYSEIYDSATGLKSNKAQISQANLCLAFPIKDFYQILKAERSKYKKAKDPIQEVYKLFLNSGYGALACEHLPVNNLLAANQITASPRATAWLMINALNGFQVITDGCTFDYSKIPLGLKFKDILESNPDYLINFNPSIESALTIEDCSQAWIDSNFIKHLQDFYGIDSNHIPANRYGYELKDETFYDIKGKPVNTTLYNEFVNSGSGNYAKGLDGSAILIDGNDYDFSDNFKKVKARSFKGSDESLLRWFVESLRDEYKEPVIYSENQIIKFGEGNRIAIQFLKDESLKDIAHPMGFARKNIKIMKLVTRSQFLFKHEKQLKNFETTNQLGKLDKLSKLVLPKIFWDNLQLKDIQAYGVDYLIDGFDYYQYSKHHTVGLGFELLALNSTCKGSIKVVRNLIADKIEANKSDFNACLNLDKYIKLAIRFKYLFAAIIVLKANAEAELKSLLINSSEEPTVLKVNSENVVKLRDLLECPDE